MKTMNSFEALPDIARILTEAEAHRNAYFFNPPTNASGRRSYEKRHTVPEFAWTEGGHTFTAEFTVSCSCHNVYARGYYTRDGEKTTLNAVRGSYNRLRRAAGLDE